VDALEALQQIANEVRECQKCSLCKTRKLSVPGEGPSNSEIMFIGEGPGFNENEQGRPFVGAAGKFLEELLSKAHLQRKDVFICNVVKCRPPNNRDPEPEEILACGQYLSRQIDAIQPKIIVTLGRFSMARFFPNARISLIHGHASRVDGCLVVAMYHPAAALHQPNLKPDLEKDFANLARLLHPEKLEPEPKPVPAVTPTIQPVQPAVNIKSKNTGEEITDTKIEEDPKQLSLF
jgi:uracil-DNA glycosylase